MSSDATPSPTPAPSAPSTPTLPGLDARPPAPAATTTPAAKKSPRIGIVPAEKLTSATLRASDYLPKGDEPEPAAKKKSKRSPMAKTPKKSAHAKRAPKAKARAAEDRRLIEEARAKLKARLAKKAPRKSSKKARLSAEARAAARSPRPGAVRVPAVRTPRVGHEAHRLTSAAGSVRTGRAGHAGRAKRHEQTQTSARAGYLPSSGSFAAKLLTWCGDHPMGRAEIIQRVIAERLAPGVDPGTKSEAALRDLVERGVLIRRDPKTLAILPSRGQRGALYGANPDVLARYKAREREQNHEPLARPAILTKGANASPSPTVANATRAAAATALRRGLADASERLDDVARPIPARPNGMPPSVYQDLERARLNAVRQIAGIDQLIESAAWT